MREEFNDLNDFGFLTGNWQYPFLKRWIFGILKNYLCQVNFLLIFKALTLVIYGKICRNHRMEILNLNRLHGQRTLANTRERFFSIEIRSKIRKRVRTSSMNSWRYQVDGKNGLRDVIEATIKGWSRINPIIPQWKKKTKESKVSDHGLDCVVTFLTWLVEHHLFKFHIRFISVYLYWGIKVRSNA